MKIFSKRTIFKAFSIKPSTKQVLHVPITFVLSIKKAEHKENVSFKKLHTLHYIK